MLSLPRPIVSPLLVGRAREMERISTTLRAAQRGEGRCVLVAGEAGIGKSRLLAEARRSASQAGFLTLQGHCFEQDVSFPYAPWIDLLRACFARLRPEQIGELLDRQAPEIVKLLPELALTLPSLQPSPPLDPEAEKRRLFEALAQFFTRLSDVHPLLVVVEDVHWSDETSLEFLYFFLRRVRDFPTMALATYRHEEAPARLNHLLAQLDRERRAEEIVLHPLGRDEVAAMVQTIFDIQRPIKADFLDLIVPLSEGNPFFIEEILKALVEADDIFYQDGRWERKSAPELHVPRSVREALQRRMEHVSPAAREVVTLAAVAGQRFDFVLLRELTALDERELLSHMRELIAKHLLVEQSADEFAFRHALTREAVYATLLERERKIAHQQIAETLERMEDGSHAARLSDLAYHFYQAGAWAKALEYARRAGARAQALFAPREALAHFTHALHAAQQLSLAPPFEALMARAKVYETLGDFEQARGDLETALEVARTSEDRRGEWQATLDLGFLWSWRDYAHSGEHALRALELARRLGDPANLARTLNRVGNWHVNRDEPFEAQPYHEEALHIFQQLNDRHGVAQTLELLSMSSYVGANSLQGAAYCEQAIPLFRDAGDREGLIRALAHLTPAQHDTEVMDPRDIAMLIAPAEEALQLAREIGWRGGETEALGYIGTCAWVTGDFARALACAHTCLALAEEVNHRFGLAMSHMMLGQVYLNLLACSNAQAHFEQARATAQACNSLVMIRFSTAHLASACMAQHDLDRAEALLGAVLADRRARTRQLRVCWNTRAELALAQGDPSQALRIADELIASAPNIDRYGPRGIPRLSLLRGEALAALGRLDEAQAALLDAREGAREQGRRPLLWRSHSSLGKLYRTLERAAEAEEAFAAARALIHELAAPLRDESLREQFLQRALAMIPAAPTLSQRQAAKQTFGGLTSREREVAALVAQGKSNRAIAGDLVLSERTVDKHVGSILAKLDFHSRAQIAVWAVEKRLMKPAE